MTTRNLITLLICTVLLAHTTAFAQKSLPLDLIKMPPGFSIEIYCDDVPNARMMAMSDKGTLFVGTWEGNVYAVKGDKVYTIATGLEMPNGVATRDGSLYVMETTRLLRFDSIESKLSNPPTPKVLNDSFPDEEGHQWKYIAFGPDGRLYVNIGSPGNSVNKEDVDERFATIASLKPDGTDLQIYARGVRQSVGFAWHPKTKEMYFTDNGRDNLGDDRPPCELNHAPRPGLHFGHPFCHGGYILDTEFGEGRSCDEFTPPAQALDAHVAPLGLAFYTGNAFPAEYHNQIFIPEHGSWNRTIPQGYRISLVKLDEDGKSLGYEIFAEGWLQRMKPWGRPVDILVLKDGSMLVSDDQNGVIYRITYESD